jgi:hypothetical protein
MNLSQRLISLTAVTAALSLSGCAAVLSGAMNSATTDQTLATKTAAYFGAEQAQIKITDINKQMLATSYKASYRGTMYNCSIYYGTVSCGKPGED